MPNFIITLFVTQDSEVMIEDANTLAKAITDNAVNVTDMHVELDEEYDQ